MWSAGGDPSAVCGGEQREANLTRRREIKARDVMAVYRMVVHQNSKMPRPSPAEKRRAGRRWYGADYAGGCQRREDTCGVMSGEGHTSNRAKRFAVVTGDRPLQIRERLPAFASRHVHALSDPRLPEHTESSACDIGGSRQLLEWCHVSEKSECFP